MTNFSEILKCIEAIIKIFKSQSNQNTKYRDDIFTELHKMGEFMQRDDYPPDQILEIESDIRRSIDSWLRNKPLLFFDEIEKFIFERLFKLLSERKHLDPKQSPEEFRREILNMVYACHFLGCRHTELNANPVTLRPPLHEIPVEDASTLHEENPPILCYVLSMILPLFIVFCFNQRGFVVRLFQTQISSRVISSKADYRSDKKDECPVAIIDSQSDNNMESRLIGTSSDKSFDLIKEEITGLAPDKFDTNVKNNTTLNAKILLSSISNLKADKGPPYTDKLDRLIPLISILNNNESIPQDKPVYQIAVAVPFSSNQKDGPLPFGLGVLRGVDQAQKELLGRNSKILLKAIIVNDSFVNTSGLAQTPQQLAYHLATKGYGGNQFIGLLGHQNTQITKLTASCYKRYGLPVLLTNILDQGNNQYVKTLLPSMSDISKRIVEILKSQETKEPPISDITIFYDNNDSSSKALYEELCREINTRKLSRCNKFNIVEKDLQAKLIKDTEIKNDQWFLAFNPFLGRRSNEVNVNDLITKNIDIAVSIVTEYSKKVKSGKIYVSHEFVDESLIKRMQFILRDSKIDILRFSPWDWRARLQNQQESEPIPGRKCFNWYAVNSLNSMLLFKQLIEDSVKDGGPHHNQNITDLRKEVSNRLNYNDDDLSGAEPNGFRIEAKDSGLTVIPNNIYKVHLIQQSKESNPDRYRSSRDSCG